MRTVRWIARSLAALLIVGGAALGFGMWVAYGDASRPTQATTVTVAEGSSVADIARQLEDSGVIRWSASLLAFERVRERGREIQAARYTFAPHRTLAEIAATLATGGRPATVWITIPEGYTAAQIGAVLQAHGIGTAAEFLAVARNSDLRIDGAMTRGLEGYLFPDTYELRRDAAPRDAANLMTETFMRELPRDYVSAARKLHLSVPQIVTAASLIEREAKVDAERPTMAGVYYNRLRRGMPLQVDSTIEYALPNHKAQLSFGDLKIDSPFNTYMYTGLPPTPIANPGKASLDAAFHPAVTPYLYYVYKGNGRHAFSVTLEQQIEAERRYLR